MPAMAAGHRRVLHYAALVLAATSPLWVIEGGGRLVARARYGVPGKAYGLWRYDSVLGAQHRENAYDSTAQTNNHGMRGTEDVFVPKPAGSLRIIAYGGSTTFCYNLTEDETWPLRLQGLLRARPSGSKDQVLNGAAVYWSLSHLFARARKDVPELRPDYVILYSGINEEFNASLLKALGVDLGAALREGRSGVFATNLPQNAWYARHLLSYRFIKYRLPLMLGAGETRHDEPRGEVISTRPDPIVLEHYLATLGEFLRFCESFGARTVFVRQLAAPDQPIRQRQIAYSRAGLAVAGALATHVVDPEPLLTGCRDTVFAPSGIHYTAAGARCLASEIFDQVRFPRVGVRAIVSTADPELPRTQAR